MGVSVRQSRSAQPDLHGGGADRLKRLDRRSPMRNLGNVNQVTPQGSLTYTNTGNYRWQDPTTGAT